MPQQKQEIIAINMINNLQEKIESLSGLFGDEGQQEHMNQHAFNELSKHNAMLHNEVKSCMNKLQHENTRLKEQIFMMKFIMDNLKQSKWYQKYSPDGDYHARQFLTRKDKEKRKDCKLCPCGELIVNKRNYFAEHQRRDKCVSSRMRIKYDKGTINVRPLNKLLTMNSHFNTMIHNPPTRYNPYGMYCLSMLMKRKYYNNL